MATLNELKTGQQGRIQAINLPPENRQRFLEMGLTIGATVKLIKLAPLGDPLEILVRGYHLSLRKSDAACITITLPE